MLKRFGTQQATVSGMTLQTETAAATAQQAADRIHQLFNAAWSLAAASAYLANGRCTDQQARVLAAVGLADPHEGGWRPAAGLTALADGSEPLGVTLPHHLHQMAAVAAGGRSRDVAADAVGEITAVETMADRLLHDVVPRLPGLADRLHTAGAAALSARAGNGRVLAAFCQLVPTLAVTAFEADPEQYERARQALSAAGVADRAELRPGELTDLDERDRYDLAQLPVMLTSPASMNGAPVRIFRALRAGGWLIAMPVSPTGDTLDTAVLHWRVADQGGTMTSPDDLEQHLRAAGFDPVLSLPDLPMPLIVAQRPSV
jgi:hypothetical protein